MMQKINCKAYVQEMKEQLKKMLETVSCQPRLAIVQVGDNQASNSYIKGKINDCAEVGIETVLYKLSSTIKLEKLLDVIDNLNNDKNIDGIIVQLPLPEHIDEKKIAEYIKPQKDVDGFGTNTKMESCTPLGIKNIILESMRLSDLSGLSVVVFGRSNIVGKPVAQMMTDLNATVTLCHSKTPFETMCKVADNADIIITAVGKQNFINPSMFNNKEKSRVIIDVGINVNYDGKLCGDVNHTCYEELNGMYTSVPGGVGLLTRLFLLYNVVYYTSK